MEKKLPVLNLEPLESFFFGRDVLLDKMIGLIDDFVLEKMAKPRDVRAILNPDQVKRPEPKAYPIGEDPYSDRPVRPPREVGDKHPFEPDKFVGAMHKDDAYLVWDATPEHAKKVDNQVKDFHQEMLRNLHPRMHSPLNAIISGVMSDPNRHYRVASDDGKYKIRARHLKAAFSRNIAKDKDERGREQYVADMGIHKDKGMHFTINERHGEDNLGKMPWFLTEKQQLDHPIDNRPETLKMLEGKAARLKKLMMKVEILKSLRSVIFKGTDTIEKSEALTLVFKTKAIESYKRILHFIHKLSDHDLSKTLKGSGLSPVFDGHDKDAGDVVDPSDHSISHPTHPDFKEMINSKKEFEALELFRDDSVSDMGVARKAMFQSDQNEFMIKPYHPVIYRSDQFAIKHPIQGWSSLATKSIYNAANIGHLCEDVSFGKHEDIPLVVSKFEDGDKMQTISDAEDSGKNHKALPDVNKKHFNQIGVMDFLMNNLDRHYSNLLVNPVDKESDGHSLLAIDHDRNFQYHLSPLKHFDWANKGRFKKGRESFDSAKLSDFLSGRIMGDLLDYMGRDNQEHSEAENHTAAWWDENKHNIKSELEKQLKLIKNEDIKDHIRDSFHSRWNVMTEWADQVNHFGAKNLPRLFSGDWHGEAPKVHFKSKEFEEKNKQFLRENLPKDPMDAVEIIKQSVETYGKISREQQHNIESLVDDYLSQLRPEQMLKLASNKELMKIKKIGHVFSSHNIYDKYVHKYNGDPRAIKLFKEHIANNPDTHQKNMINHFWLPLIEERD